MVKISTSRIFEGEKINVYSKDELNNVLVKTWDVIIDYENNKIYIVKEWHILNKSDIEEKINEGKIASVEAEILKVTKPKVESSSDYAKPGDTVTFTASGSHSPDSSNITYHWILPDWSTQEGDTLNFVVPSTAKEGDEYKITCYATDEFGNKSPSEIKKIQVVENYPPVIQKIEWNSDTLVAWNTYHVKITAIDPEATTLTYDLTCSDSAVSITKTATNEFDVYFPKKSSTYSVDFTYSVTDADWRTTTKTETKTILVIKERVYQIPDDNTEPVYANTIDDSSFVYVVNYTADIKVWYWVIDINWHITKQFEITDFLADSAGYVNNYLILIGKDSAWNKKIIKVDLDWNVIKAIQHDFEYSKCLVNDNNLYSLLIRSSSNNHWGYYVLYDENLNQIVAKKVEYNKSGSKYSDANRRRFDFNNAWIVVSWNDFEIVSRSLMYRQNKEECRIKIKTDWTIQAIWYRNSTANEFTIVGRYNTFVNHRTTDGYKVSFVSNVWNIKIYVKKFNWTKNVNDNQNWNVITYSRLNDRPIISWNSCILYIDNYTTDGNTHWPAFKLNKNFQFKVWFESIPFNTFNYEFYIWKLNNKAAILWLLKSYDITDRGCANVNITSEERCFYKYSNDVWGRSSIEYSWYQIYYYDETVNDSDITSSITTNSTSLMLISCDLA